MTSITTQFSQLPTSPFAGFRNRVVNGGCQISQQFGTTAQTATTAGVDIWPIDNWLYGGTTGTVNKVSVGQSTDAPTGFTNSVVCTVTTSAVPGTSDYLLLGPAIEGINMVDFQMGSTANVNITVSFWVKGSVAGTYSAVLGNGVVSTTYVFTFSVTTSWTQVQVTIPSTTLGTWVINNTAGMRLYFNLGAGSSYSTATTNTWQVATYVNNTGTTQFVSQTATSTLKIAGIQIELGSTATPFEQRPYQIELAMCQRYLMVYSGTGALELPGYSYSTTQSLFQIFYPVSMAAAPTLITSALSTFSLYNGSLGSGTPTSITLRTSSISVICLTVVTTAASPTLVAGAGALFYSANSSSVLALTAQL